jgi:hypothetical protein
MTERPDNLEPCPPDVAAFLEQMHPSGEVTHFDVALQAFVERTRPGLHQQVVDGLVSHGHDAPDAEGVYTVTFFERDTGETVMPLEVHWTALVDEPPSLN